jgi:hypothetical protein
VPTSVGPSPTPHRDSPGGAALASVSGRCAAGCANCPYFIA